MFSQDNVQFKALDLPDRANLTDAETGAAAAEFYDVMKRRHSVRDFSDRGVDRGVIEDCIRAAGSAPSGANHQP